MINYASTFVMLMGLALMTPSCERPSRYADFEAFNGKLAYGDSLISPVPQYATGRLFEAQSTSEALRFSVHPGQADESTDPRIIMQMPTQVEVDQSEGFIYVMDTESALINKFSLPDGALLASIETVQEYRKSESTRPALQVLPDGSLQICNLGDRRIIRLRPDGAVEQAGTLPRGISGCTVGTSNGEQIALNPLNDEELFHILGKRGQTRRTFGMLSNLHVREAKSEAKSDHPVVKGHGIDFVGTIGTSGESSFVYAGSQWGGLIGFNTDGTFRFYRETIAHYPFPRLVRDRTGDPFQLQMSSDPSEGSRFVINVWEGVYYQQIFPPCTEEVCPQTFTVDAYSYDTGDYLYSFRTPTNCAAMFITESHIYANCLGRGVIQYIRPARPSPFA